MSRSRSRRIKLAILIVAALGLLWFMAELDRLRPGSAEWQRLQDLDQLVQEQDELGVDSTEEAPASPREPVLVPCAISGHVTSEDVPEPLAGVRVRLLWHDVRGELQSREALTGAQGEFSFEIPLALDAAGADGQVDVAGVGEMCASQQEIDGQPEACQGVRFCDLEAGALACTADTPSAEACNALDDDCDGWVDEAFDLNSVCEVGVGACNRTGITKCDGDGAAVVCSAMPGEPVDEVCNGLDDDCDGSIDEAIAHYLDNYAKVLAKWDATLAEKGVAKVELAQSEIDAFRAKAADPIREEWIATMEGQGLPGQELYDLVVKTLDEHRASN